MSSALPCQRLQEFQAGIVAPMHIFKDEQYGLFDGLARKEVRQGSEEAAFLPFGIRRAWWGLIGWHRDDVWQ